MLVVDRRGGRAHPLGTNRAEHQARLDQKHLCAVLAPLQAESPKTVYDSNRGIPCIVETPGPEKLLHLLLERVWGVVV